MDHVVMKHRFAVGSAPMGSPFSRMFEIII
jgi:hypothetical protein